MDTYFFIRIAEIRTRKIYTPGVLMVSGFDMKPKSVKGSSTIPDTYCDFKPGYRCLEGSLNQGGFFMAPVVSFDNVEVLRVGLNNPVGANTLFLVCGVAVINFHGPLNDYNRDTVTFLVPYEGQIDPNDPALDVGFFRDSTVIAFPATIEASPERPVGWGVDSVDTISVGNNVQLTANLAALNPGSTIIRMGFQVNILSFV